MVSSVLILPSFFSGHLARASGVLTDFVEFDIAAAFEWLEVCIVCFFVHPMHLCIYLPVEQEEQSKVRQEQVCFLTSDHS